MEQSTPQEWWWVIDANGQQQGPMPYPQLIGMVVKGQVIASTLVWQHGLPGWTAAGQISNLYFPPQPPAPPQLTASVPLTMHAPAPSKDPTKVADFWGRAFKPIENDEDARKRIKDAGTVALIIAAMEFFGSLTYFFGEANDAEGASPDLVGAGIAYATIIAALLAIGYAMRRGRGGIILPLMVLALFVFEVGAKLANGWHPAMAGWLIFYVLLGATLWSGVRASLFLRRATRHR